MAQQTAVDWLIMQLPVKIRVELYEQNIHEQAKQMEKEQRIAAQKGIELKKAISRITNEIKKDINYRESWKANIAMAYKDCEHWYKKETGKKRLNKEDKHIIANNAAEHFLNLLCNNK